MAENEYDTKPPKGPEGKIWDPDEELERWKTEYEGIKNELDNPSRETLGGPETGADSPLTTEGEKRVEPRYAFDQVAGASIFVHLGPKAFEILNFSVGGVAFFSDTYFPEGTNLLLSALGMIALDVDVLSCEIEETDSGLMEFKYRVRGKFGPRVNGYQVYVLAREMYLNQVKEARGPDATKRETQ